MVVAVVVVVIVVVVVCVRWVCVGMDGWGVSRQAVWQKRRLWFAVVILRRGPVSGGWLRQVI